MTKEEFYRKMRSAIQNFKNNVVLARDIREMAIENELPKNHTTDFLEFYSKVPNVQQDNNMMQGDVINVLDAWHYEVPINETGLPKEKKKRKPRPRKKVDKPTAPVRVSRTPRAKKKPAAKKQPVKKKK